MKTSVEILEVDNKPAANEVAYSVLNRTPIAGAKSYFRSRIFSAHVGINPLLAAAEPLLILNSQLKHAVPDQDINKFDQAIIHEVNAFETQAKNRGYRAETILIGRYILCASVDETILQSAWGQQCLWEQHKLLNIFQQDKSADEKFFLVLERISEDPKQHIDLLELIYVCLSLGFKGKFRHLPHGMNDLNDIIDKLYRTIRLHREEIAPLLSTDHSIQYELLDTKTPSLILLTLKTILITISACLLIYFGFAYLFDLVTTPIQQQIQQIVATSSYLSTGTS